VANGITPQAAIRRRVVRTPDIRIAGYLTYNEADYPLHDDVPDVDGRLRRLFPHAERYFTSYTYNKPGQPS
jgi:hypothetical protein